MSTHPVWNAHETSDQGLIIEEGTGRNVAVTYDAKDAPLVAAAPDLLDACEAFIEAWEKCLQLEKTDTALRMAREAVKKAKGE